MNPFLLCNAFCLYSFGFFFGPSQPAISQRVIEESKKSPKFQQLASRVTILPNVCMGISLLCVGLFLEIDEPIKHV